MKKQYQTPRLKQLAYDDELLQSTSIEGYSGKLGAPRHNPYSLDSEDNEAEEGE